MSVTRSGDEHYTLDVVGGRRQLPGAGILAWLTYDQLHPPMLSDDEMWCDGTAWADGARRYVLELGHAVDLSSDERVLDIGCGICGPARLIVDNFGVRVSAITNSQVHEQTSRLLNTHTDRHKERIQVQYVRRLDEWPGGPYDVAWSLNMLYQVADHQELYAWVASRLASGGRFLLDDWMVTDRITESDLQAFRHHFQYQNLVRLSRIESELVSAGFFPSQRIIDRGSAARGAMQRHFRRVMEAYFMPILDTEWPAGNQEGISGSQMALDFIDAVELTLRLYAERKLTYRTVVAVKA